MNTLLSHYSSVNVQHRGMDIVNYLPLPEPKLSFFIMALFSFLFVCLFILINFLLLAALGLHCHALAFSVAVSRLLEVAFLVAEHRL